MCHARVENLKKGGTKQMTEYSHFYDRTGNRRYVQAFNQIILDKNLNNFEFRLYLYLKIYAGKNGMAFPSQDKIMSELNISKPKLIQTLKSLQEKKYLIIEKEKTSNGYSKNNYYVYDPFVETSLNEFEKCNHEKQNDKKVDNVGQSLALIFNTFINVSQTVISDIEQSLEVIGDNAYPITEIVIEYTKNQNKGVGYLSGILFNFKKEKITTVEQAKQSLKPRTNKKQKQQEKSNFWEEQFKEVGDN